MCEPTTIAIASLAATALGGVMSFAGAQQQADAQSRAANYNAAVARNNRIHAERLAEDAKARGDIEANKERQRGRQLQGLAIATAAANGVDVGSESVIDLLSTTALNTELDAQTIRHNAHLEAQAYRAKAGGYEADAALSTMAARDARAAGRIAGVSSLVSTGTKVAGKWYNYDYEGVL